MCSKYSVVCNHWGLSEQPCEVLPHPHRTLFCRSVGSEKPQGLSLSPQASYRVLQSWAWLLFPR